jgi:uncharacterized flavoprotein (TIGR03862 family)
MTASPSSPGPAAAVPAVAVIGGGPAGLMAAEALSGHGLAVAVFDAMPSAGRKLLMAGKSGLNLTHGEPLETFLDRYGDRRRPLEAALRAFDNAAVREWAAGLGVATFVGSSGRVFPADFKAAPLLRAWLRRLRAAGVRFHMRHRWQGWAADGGLRFATAEDGETTVRPLATVLALGGASWPRLGSDAAWVPWLRAAGVAVAPFRPANCGFEIAWSAPLRDRFAGAPVKAVTLSFDGTVVRGECTVTPYGLEGSAVYTLSAALRDALDRGAAATLTLDLAPDRSEARLAGDLARPRGGRSLAGHLKRQANLSGVKAALLREGADRDTLTDPAALAARIKALPLRPTAARPVAEAISSAGGVAFAGLDERFMLTARPGVFCCGEMMDWEAPTGGYLLTACLATGRAAGAAAAAWAASRR